MVQNIRVLAGPLCLSGKCEARAKARRVRLNEWVLFIAPPLCIIKNAIEILEPYTHDSITLLCLLLIRESD
mgnify:CR=1